MSIDLKKALNEKGLNATYEGNPAKLLPISENVLSEYKSAADAKTGKHLVAGDMIVTWRGENGGFRGEVLDPMADNDLKIMIRKSDGEDMAVPAGDMGDAIVRLSALVKDDKQNRAELAETNRAAEKAHRAAVARNEIDEDEQFTPVKPRFADGAFAKLPDLVDCMKSRLSVEYGNEFTGAAGKSLAALNELKVGDATRHNLTDAELAKAKEAHALRAEIAKLEANAAEAPQAEREHGTERVEAALEDLRYPGEGINQAQMAAIMPNQDLMNLAFQPFTTLPPHEIQARRLGPRDANTVLQDLRRFEDKEWGTSAVEKCRKLLKSRMPGYDFSAKVFSRDGADMLMVADQAGAVLYAWDSETRVNDFDTAPELVSFSEADVPSDEELEALRAQLRDMRYDANGDIDFDFDIGGDDEDPVLEG
ncbi:hypothetical protein [Leisingera caerulea]|uniref:hypothetical protein n=1 Tax=Leisingera caerulea TaxID=506591 RepID=UPI000403971C|nr:hypothetical protein [Leisingera caerulea]